jgi:hypothetical protein
MQTIRIIHDERNHEHIFSSPDIPNLLVRGELLSETKEDLHEAVERLLKARGFSGHFKLVRHER